MGVIEVFNLVGRIAIDAKGADSTIDSVKSRMESLGTTIEKAGSKISGVGSRLTKTVTVVGTTVTGVAVKSAIDFEDAMAKIDTIANITSDNAKVSYGEMEKAIMDLSNQTGVSAAAIADDVYNAISAGQDVGDAVNFVSNSTKLAKAGFAETSQSLDILTTILNAYGMEASEVTRVSDILIQTQNLGKTTVGDLSSTMGKIIPTAKSYKVSLEQVAAGYSIMTAKGIATAETTTYMNSMLNELGKSGTTVSDILVEKTGKSFSDLMQEGYTLGDCLEMVNQAAIEQNLSFMDMWGSAESAKAGVTLLGDSATVFNSRLQEMRESTGSTEMAFEKLDTTSLKLTKVINQAKNTLMDLGGTILEMLMPYLEKGAAEVEKFATWFNNLDDGTKKLIVTIGGLAIAAGPVLKITGSLVSGIGNIIKIGGQIGPMISKIIPAGKTLIGGMGNLMQAGGKLITGIGSKLLPALAQFGPQGAVIALVVAGVAFLGYEIYKHWDEISGFLTKAWDGLKAAASKVMDFFKDNWQGIALFIVNPIAGGLKLAYDNCEGFRDFINGWGEKIRNGWESLTASISNGISRFGENAKQKFSDMKENVVGRMEEMKEKSVARFEELKTKATDKIEELKENAAEKISNMQHTVSEKFTKLKEDAVEKVHTLKENAVQGFEDMRESVSNKVHELTTAAGEKFEELKTTASEKITALKEENARRFQELKDSAVEQIGNLRDRAVEGFHDLKEKAAGSIETLKTDATKKIADIATAAGEKFKAVGSGLLDMFGSVRDKLGSIVENVKGFFNFNWKFPDIKLPHFSVTWDSSGLLGQAAQALGLQGIPKIGVQWYKDGGVMMKPTAFAFNPMTGSIHAGGEAGPEAIAPVTVLQDYIRSAVSESNGELAVILLNIYNLLLRYMPELADMQMVLDTGETVGALALPINDALGKIAARRDRIK